MNLICGTSRRLPSIFLSRLSNFVNSAYLDAEDVHLHSVELGRAVDLADDWTLAQHSIRATTDNVEKRKEIKRSKRATQETA